MASVRVLLHLGGPHGLAVVALGLPALLLGLGHLLLGQEGVVCRQALSAGGGVGSR